MQLGLFVASNIPIKPLISHFNNETKLKITSFQILAKPVAGSSDVIAPPEASPVRLRRPQARDGARGRCLQKEIPACTFLKSLEVPRLQVLLPFMMNRADFPFVSCLHFQHSQPFIILLATSPRACVQQRRCATASLATLR